MKIRHIAAWSLFYIAIYGSLTVASCFFLPKQALAAIGMIGAVFIFVNIFLLPFQRKWLFVGGIISALGVMCGGIWIAKQLDTESVLSIGAVVTVMDILSFMKIGKRTVNAKAMSNVRLTSKLFVYGKEKGNTLIPTSGIGDYLYYAVWISGIHSVSSSVYAYIAAAGMIFWGTAIQHTVIAK